MDDGVEIPPAVAYFLQSMAMMCVTTVLVAALFLITQCTDRGNARRYEAQKRCTDASGTWLETSAGNNCVLGRPPTPK